MIRVGVVLGGRPLAVEADAALAPQVALALAAWPRGGGDGPTLRLRPAEGAAPEGALPLREPGGREVGWAVPIAGGLEVSWREPHAADAGLRLLLARAFPPPGALLLHGAGLARGGRGLVAVGPSGAGKSTLAGLCDGLALLSDETVIVEAGPSPRVHGTPFRSSCPREPVAASAALAAIVALEKGPSPSLRPLPRVACVELLLSQAFRHGTDAAALLDAAVALAQAVPAYVLTFAKEPSCCGLLERLLT